MSRTTYQDPSIVIKRGQKPGRNLIILAGVHGNELAGVKALRTAIDTINVQRGQVNFIFANPPAIARNVRAVDMNLNRAFRPVRLLKAWEKKSYERARALELMPYLDKCDAMLDLHSVYRKPATPFIICGDNELELAKKFPLPIRSTGWDDIEPGSTDHYARTRNKIALCIECGQRDDIKAYQVGLKAIKTFLTLQGAISSTKKIVGFTEQREVRVSYIYKTRKNFKPSRMLADFTPVEKGLLLGRDGNTPIPAPFTGLVIFINNASRPNEEAFIMGR